MKNILFALLLLTVTANAQTLRMDQVPKAVSQAFRLKYASAQQESWELVAKFTYQVGFFNAKKRQTARFDDKGQWLETETEMNFNQLPRAVSNAVAKQFPGFDVQIANLLESPTGDALYEIVLFKGRENWDVTFSAKGEVLKKEAGSSE